MKRRKRLIKMILRVSSKIMKKNFEFDLMKLVEQPKSKNWKSSY